MRILPAALALFVAAANTGTTGGAFVPSSAVSYKSRHATPSLILQHPKPALTSLLYTENQSFLEDAKDLMASMKSTAVPVEVEEEVPTMPPLGEDGIYKISNEAQHKAFLEANQDKLVIMKFYAPWCRACKGLEPKFRAIAHDKKYDDLPIVWSELSVQHNKEFVKSLGVLALPSMHFYASGQLVENFPCGPSKVPILKRKLVQLINDRVDPKTRQLKVLKPEDVTMECETEPCNVDAAVGGVLVSPGQMSNLRNELPFFKDFSDEEFYNLMDKAKLQTFEEGAIIMRQGMPGKTFYVIQEGEVEVAVKTAFEDPLTTPSTYLGAVVNRLTAGNYFGERALITGEPRAASIRAASNVTRCFAFQQEDIPKSSVLSGNKRATTERMQQVNDKYGVDVYDIDFIKDQFQKANVENQKRGSVNTPEVIYGVDTEDEEQQQQQQQQQVASSEEMIIPLLIRFKLIRHAARCFNYIMRTKPKWGDVGELNRRSMLVSKLTHAQKVEFTDVFHMIDSSGDGLINLIELKRVMESIGEAKTDEELKEMINKGDPSVNGNTCISYGDFMGVMAEAEFYHLFKDTFAVLDVHDTGFVKASDLDRVLCGVRDLISDDRMSIIDVEDKDMMIDYEQFSQMLLGTGAAM